MRPGDDLEPSTVDIEILANQHVTIWSRSAFSAELDVVMSGVDAAVRELAVDPARVRALASELGERELDGPAARVLALVTVVAALDDLLRDREPSDEERAERVRAVLVSWLGTDDVVQRYLTARYGLDPSHPSDAWQEAAVRFRERGQAMYGSTFSYEQVHLDERHSAVDVHRCFFNDYLRGVGKPQLISIFCAFDNLIAAEFERSPAYGIEFRQVTAMGRGDDRCRFRFRRL